MKLPAMEPKPRHFVKLRIINLPDNTSNDQPYINAMAQIVKGFRSTGKHYIKMRGMTGGYRFAFDNKQRRFIECELMVLREGKNKVLSVDLQDIKKTIGAQQSRIARW